MDSSGNARPFGQQLYDQLVDRGKLVSERLSFAAIQELKSASRQDVQRLFRVRNRTLLAMLETDPPEVIAAFFVGYEEGARGAMTLLGIGGPFWP